MKLNKIRIGMGKQYQYKTIMTRNYYSEPQMGFRTYSFVSLDDFYTICHRTRCQQSHRERAAKKLIHITKIRVGTSTIPSYFSHAFDDATLKRFINSIITPSEELRRQVVDSVVCVHGWCCGQARESGVFVLCDSCNRFFADIFST